MELAATVVEKTAALKTKEVTIRVENCPVVLMLECFLVIRSFTVPPFEADGFRAVRVFDSVAGQMLSGFPILPVQTEFVDFVETSWRQAMH
jgi:hypothetical protein